MLRFKLNSQINLIREVHNTYSPSCATQKARYAPNLRLLESKLANERPGSDKNEKASRRLNEWEITSKAVGALTSQRSTETSEPPFPHATTNRSCANTPIRHNKSAKPTNLNKKSNKNSPITANTRPHQQLVVGSSHNLRVLHTPPPPCCCSPISKTSGTE